MAGLLSEFLHSLDRREWCWGETDCFLVMCDWIGRMTGIDPAAPWRGTYHSEAQARAILKRRGGLMCHVNDALALCGFVPTGDPQIGDVGIVLAPTQVGRRVVKRPVCAIRDGCEQWVAMSNIGVVRLSGSSVKTIPRIVLREHGVARCGVAGSYRLYGD